MYVSLQCRHDVVYAHSNSSFKVRSVLLSHFLDLIGISLAVCLCLRFPSARCSVRRRVRLERAISAQCKCVTTTRHIDFFFGDEKIETRFFEIRVQTLFLFLFLFVLLLQSGESTCAAVVRIDGYLASVIKMLFFEKEKLTFLELSMI